jgi:hypothetical protein
MDLRQCALPVDDQSFCHLSQQHEHCQRVAAGHGIVGAIVEYPGADVVRQERHGLHLAE